MIKSIFIQIFFLFLTVSTFANETNEYGKLVNDAALQISYLEKYNSVRDRNQQWYIYFLGKDVKFLSDYLSVNSEQNFSAGFLDKLNDDLTLINSNEVEMYLAITDLDSPITLPLMPLGGSMQKKIEYLQNQIEFPSDLNTLQSIEQLISGKEEFIEYQKAFWKLGRDIYNASPLKTSRKKYRILPFSVFHTIEITSRKTSPIELYRTSSTYSVGEKIDKDELKNYRSELDGYGSYSYEKSISATIQMYGEYFQNRVGSNNLTDGVEVTFDSNSDLSKAAYENRNTPDEQFKETTRILDFAGITSETDKTTLASSLGTTTLLKGMKMYVVFTDDDTKNEVITRLQNLQPSSDKYYTWIHFSKDGNAKINTIVPKGFNDKIRRATQHWTADVWDNFELNSNKATKDILFSYIVAQNHMMSLLAGLMEKLVIPKQYWDANDPSYITEMQYVAQAFEASSSNLTSIFDAYKAQMAFAFKVGIFNGVVEEFKGLVDLGELITSYITDQEKAKVFDKAIGDLTLAQLWQSVEKAHGFEEGKPLEEFQLSHQLGKDVVFVASFWIGIGELTSATKMAKALNSVKKLLTFGSIKLSRKLSTEAVTALRTLPDNIRKVVFTKLDDLASNADINKIISTLKIKGKYLTEADELLNQLILLHGQALKEFPGSVKSLDGFIDDLEYFVFKEMNNVKTKNVTEFFNEMLQAEHKMKAGATSLEVIKNPSKYMDDVGDLEGLEDVLSTATGDGDFRFDLKFKSSANNNPISILVDTKNYANASGIFKSMKQIKAYFKQIKSFKELRIVQQGGRPGLDLDKMKSAFQSALKKEPREIFNTNKSLFKTIKFNNKPIKNYRDFENFVKSSEFLDSDLASILKITL